MAAIVIRLEHRVKVRLRRTRRETNDKGLAQRCQVVLLAAKGRGRAAIADGVGCSASWVNRVVARFRDDGEAGLPDRRADNGPLKLDGSTTRSSRSCTPWSTARPKITATAARRGRAGCWRRSCSR